MTSTPFRFKAVIVPTVLKQRASHGLPQGTASVYDVDEQQCKRFLERINAKRIPLVYNHTDHLQLGHVVSASMNSKGGLEIEAETDQSTPLGLEATKWIKEGSLAAVSLRHMSVVNEPEEVSLCWSGARGPEARCHSIYDSNTRSYIPINASPVSIAASSLGPISEDFLEFYALSDIQMSTTVAASADPTMTSPASPASPSATEVAPSPSFSVDKIKALAESKIPTKEQRLEAQLNSNDLAQALAKMQSERAAMEADLNELREIKAAKKKKQEEEEAKTRELKRSVVGDFEMTLAADDAERAGVPARIAAMTEVELDTLYKAATRVKASLYPPASQKKESEEEQQNNRRIREYIAGAGYQTFQTDTQMSHQEPSSVNASKQYSSWNSNSGYQKSRENAQVLFENLKSCDPQWGQPIECPPQSMVVSASAYRPYLQPVAKNANKAFKWKPGQGLNMNWSFMQPNEAAVHAVHGQIDMDSETKLKMSSLVFSDDVSRAGAKYRKDGGTEYERVMASLSTMGLTDGGELPPHLRDGGGLNWIEDQMRSTRRGR